MTLSKCQHDKEDTERTRGAWGKGSYLCLLGVVSGGGREERRRVLIKREAVLHILYDQIFERRLPRACEIISVLILQACLASNFNRRENLELLSIATVI